MTKKIDQFAQYHLYQNNSSNSKIYIKSFANSKSPLKKTKRVSSMRTSVRNSLDRNDSIFRKNKKESNFAKYEKKKKNEPILIQNLENKKNEKEVVQPNKIKKVQQRRNKLNVTKIIKDEISQLDDPQKEIELSQNRVTTVFEILDNKSNNKFDENFPSKIIEESNSENKTSEAYKTNEKLIPSEIFLSESKNFSKNLKTSSNQISSKKVTNNSESNPKIANEINFNSSKIITSDNNKQKKNIKMSYYEQLKKKRKMKTEQTLKNNSSIMMQKSTKTNDKISENEKVLISQSSNNPSLKIISDKNLSKTPSNSNIIKKSSLIEKSNINSFTDTSIKLTKEENKEPKPLNKTIPKNKKSPVISKKIDRKKKISNISSRERNFKKKKSLISQEILKKDNNDLENKKKDFQERFKQLDGISLKNKKAKNSQPSSHIPKKKNFFRKTNPSKEMKKSFLSENKLNKQSQISNTLTAPVEVNKFSSKISNTYSLSKSKNISHIDESLLDDKLINKQKNSDFVIKNISPHLSHQSLKNPVNSVHENNTDIKVDETDQTNKFEFKKNIKLDQSFESIGIDNIMKSSVSQQIYSRKLSENIDSNFKPTSQKSLKFKKTENISFKANQMSHFLNQNSKDDDTKEKQEIQTNKKQTDSIKEPSVKNIEDNKSLSKKSIKLEEIINDKIKSIGSSLKNSVSRIKEKSNKIEKSQSPVIQQNSKSYTPTRKTNKSINDYIKKGTRPSIKKSIRRSSIAHINNPIKKTKRLSVRDSINKSHKLSVKNSIKRSPKKSTHDSNKRSKRSSFDNSDNKLQNSSVNNSTNMKKKLLRPLIRLENLQTKSISRKDSIKKLDSKKNLMKNLAKLKKFEPLVLQKSEIKEMSKSKEKDETLKKNIFEVTIKEISQSNYNTQQSNKDFEDIENKIFKEKNMNQEKTVKNILQKVPPILIVNNINLNPSSHKTNSKKNYDSEENTNVDNQTVGNFNKTKFFKILLIILK